MIELPPFTLTYTPAMRGPRGRRETFYEVHITHIHAHPWLHIDLHVSRQSIGDGVEHFTIDRVFFRRGRDARWSRDGSLDGVVIDHELWAQILDAIPHRMMQARIWTEDDDDVELGYTWNSSNVIHDIELGRWEKQIPSDVEYEQTNDVLMEEIATFLAGDPRLPVPLHRSEPRTPDADGADGTPRAQIRNYFEELLDELQSWNDGQPDDGGED